jgi:hypothetical protein
MVLHRPSLALRVIVCLLLFFSYAHAQERFDIPSPRAVLGFTPGDDRTIADWRQITDYFARLDRASDRVMVRQLGRTTLDRPLIVAFISAPENIRDLAKYQEIARRLADPRSIRDDRERERLIGEGRVVVAISCSIHSTEIVASQMSMQLAYELATATDPETREILANVILLLIPSANPDGVDIVANWYRKTLRTPYEGVEPPELYHHYAGHDNNRDWFMLNLPETQLITRLFWQEWFPQIVYDVHQQGTNGSRMFVPPFYDPFNPHIAPLLLREVGLLGHKIAADLQAAGFQGVITNAMYDTWWHGGFRTAPYYHNSIGILSEAASARLMTPVTVTREQLAQARTRGMDSALEARTNFPDPWPGGVWRPRDILQMEIIAARAVLTMAAKYRERYLRNFYELGLRALSVPSGAPLAYLIPAGQGRDENLAKMLTTLIEQGIEVHRLDRELHVSTEQAGEREAPAGSYLILLSQPYRADVQALFEPQRYPNRRLTSGEAERPYDVAGWTLPMQMGIEYLPIMSVREPRSAWRLTLVKDETEIRRDLGLPPRHDSKSPVQSPIPHPPRIGIYRSWVATADEGWTRFVLDTFNIPYRSVLDAELRAENSLRSKYDVIILPSQRMREIIDGNSPDRYPAEYAGGMTEKGVENLRRFVEDGGVLICFDAATELAIKRFDLPVRNALEGLRSSEFYCPGSILALDVDTNHPMAKGLPPRVDAYFINSAAFDVMDQRRARIVARYAAQNVLRSGWLLGEKHIQGKAALVEVTMGRGRIVLFGFRPQHRGQTWGTFPFIFNALALAESPRNE